MVELIFVRHGRIDSNVRRAYCGQTDRELDAEGVRQAQGARDRLKEIKLDGIFASPLKRTLKTAQIINEFHKIDIAPSESIMEQNFGIWEDCTWEEICTRNPEEAKYWRDDWKDYCMEKGESSRQVHERNAGFIDGLLERHKSGTFLIVTHLGCIRHLLAHLLGMGMEGFWRFQAGNCAIIRVAVNDEGFAHLYL